MQTDVVQFLKYPVLGWNGRSVHKTSSYQEELSVVRCIKF